MGEEKLRVAKDGFPPLVTMPMATEQQRQRALGRLDIGMIKKTASSIQEAMQDAEQTISTIKMAISLRKITFTKQTSTPILEAIG